MLRAAAEIRICLISLYCGTLIGLMYDIFAFIRLPFNENRIIDAALDIMYLRALPRPPRCFMRTVGG